MRELIAEVIADEASLEELRPEWEELSSPRVRDNPFLSHGWNCICAAYRGAGTVLNVIVLRDRAGKAQAIAPLAIETERAGPFRYRRLCFIGEGISDYHDFIARDDEPGLIAALWRETLEGGACWDRAKLCDFPASSPSLAASAISGARLELRRASPCPKMELPSSWDELMARLPVRLVKDAVYQERRLEREGRLEYSEVATRHDVDSFLGDFFRLHEKRWGGTPTPSKFTKERARARMSELAASMFDAGYASYSRLSHDGRVIAAHLGFATPSTMYYYMPAYDTDFDRYSIGRALYFKVLRAAFDRGIRSFDFLRGGEEYKLRWGGTEGWNEEALGHRWTLGWGASLALEVYRRLRDSVRGR